MASGKVQAAGLESKSEVVSDEIMHAGIQLQVKFEGAA